MVVHQEFNGTPREVCNTRGLSRGKVLIQWLMNPKVAFSEGTREGAIHENVWDSDKAIKALTSGANLRMCPRLRRLG